MKCPASFRWFIGCAVMVDALTAHAAVFPVNVTPPLSVSSAVAPSPVEQTKREAALTLAHMLPDPAFASSLIEEFDQTSKVDERSALLQAVLDRYQAKRAEGSAQSGTNANVNAQENPTQDLRRLDRSLLAYKGIQHLSSGLLQVRLYQPAGNPLRRLISAGCWWLSSPPAMISNGA
jgi:hypothetical protein